MEENIKVRWLTDHEQTKIAPKTLITSILNEDGTRFKNKLDATITEMTESIDEGKRKTRDHANNTEIHVTPEEKEAWSNIEVPSLDGYATEDYVENLYKKLNTNTTLGFYCIEDVTIVVNGISTIYPANSNVEIKFAADEVFEIIPTSDNSILALTAFPRALGTFYPWLEGVAQFSNILFDMNTEDMYTKWNQGNQGSYHVQAAQYTDCIFWSDNAYISDISKRTNYTLTHTSQLPLCYSSIPDNTFKAFYLAFGVNSDPNWGNKAYRDSFAKATWATQVFSYYGARTIGIVGHDDPDFNIVLPKDCRGLMFDARNIENAGTFDAINTTNFGAQSGSWREAFGDCTSLKRLYIKNLKVNLNLSWSPIDYDSISFIISAAANTNAITISVSPYTYNLLSPSDFELATSKNITIALLTGNYVEDRRLSAIANKADKTELEGLASENYVNNAVASIVDSAPETLNTLNELSAALGNDSNFATTVATQIGNKVDKVEGMGLSSNDFTDEEKEKLASLDTLINDQISSATAGVVKSVNGVAPDEAGNVVTIEPYKYVFINSPFGFIAPYTADELFAYATDTSHFTRSSFICRVQNPTNPTLPVQDYNCTKIDIYSSKMVLYFGDNVAPIIVDKSANTIVIDSNWVAPMACVKTINGIEPDEAGNVAIEINSETVEVDETLTQSGAAADAKVVGDALAEKQPVGDYALRSEVPSVDGLATEIYVQTQIASIPTPDVSGQINAHNTATDSHNDIRLLVEGLTTRLNALADSDDTTLDQMSEIVAYIKSNKNLIDGITTNKVNVSDIIDNLTTNVVNKPLSAAQGVALKALIDGLDTDKLDASELASAVNNALAQAKASGEFDGDTGVGISSVRQTTTSTADDGNNVITVTLTNGTTSTFTVQNGSKGSKGDSPVRGTDYWTAADKAEIKSYVDDAILNGVW